MQIARQGQESVKAVKEGGREEEEVWRGAPQGQQVHRCTFHPRGSSLVCAASRRRPSPTRREGRRPINAREFERPKLLGVRFFLGVAAI
jgi:hypothetical protein